MGKFVLIGGGNVGRGMTEYETEKIDMEIVKMTEKSNPNFLFIGLASSFSDSYYDTMKKIYQNLGCNCQYLKKKNILNNRGIVENKIGSADIIYFCGGDSIKLVNDLKQFDLVSLLKDSIDRNAVIVGMSAGAIMISDKGYSDSLKLREESNKYDFVDGLNFVDINFSPHFLPDSDKTKELEVDLKINNYKVVALPNGCALKIVDNNYELISENDKIGAKICFYKDKFVCNDVPISGYLEDLR